MHQADSNTNESSISCWLLARWHARTHARGSVGRSIYPSSASWLNNHALGWHLLPRPLLCPCDDHQPVARCRHKRQRRRWPRYRERRQHHRLRRRHRHRRRRLLRLPPHNVALAPYSRTFMLWIRRLRSHRSSRTRPISTILHSMPYDSTRLADRLDATRLTCGLCACLSLSLSRLDCRRCSIRNGCARMISSSS